jgi:hypothetical protein
MESSKLLTGAHGYVNRTLECNVVNRYLFPSVNVIRYFPVGCPGLYHS